MARAKGILENLHGRLDNNTTICHRNGKAFTRPAHIRQPHRLSREQLPIRERQSHNNALWRALKATKQVYFEGENTAYNCFMSVNRESPVPFLTKQHYYWNTALLLPDMYLSFGPLLPVSYQLGDVDGQPALLTDLSANDLRHLAAPDTYGSPKDFALLLYVLHQRLLPQQTGEEWAQLSITVEPLTKHDFTTVPSTILSPYKNPKGTLALVSPRFSDPMLGFGIVRLQAGHASTQRVVTRCTYYERFTTEEALQAAADSYGGLTTNDTYLNPKSR